MGRVAKEREKLEKAEAQAVSYVHRLGRRVARAEKQEDSRATRRKIVAGAAVLTMARKDASLRARFAAFLQDFVTRPADRLALELDEPEIFLDRDAREAAAAEKEKARAAAAQVGDDITAALSSLESGPSKSDASGGKDARVRTGAPNGPNAASTRSVSSPPPPNGSGTPAAPG